MVSCRTAWQLQSSWYLHWRAQRSPQRWHISRLQLPRGAGAAALPAPAGPPQWPWWRRRLWGWWPPCQQRSSHRCAVPSDSVLKASASPRPHPGGRPGLVYIAPPSPPRSTRCPADGAVFSRARYANGSVNGCGLSCYNICTTTEKIESLKSESLAIYQQLRSRAVRDCVAGCSCNYTAYWSDHLCLLCQQGVITPNLRSISHDHMLNKWPIRVAMLVVSSCHHRQNSPLPPCILIHFFFHFYFSNLKKYRVAKIPIEQGIRK